jgi:hypothetical protein
MAEVGRNNVVYGKKGGIRSALEKLMIFFWIVVGLMSWLCNSKKITRKGIWDEVLE